MRLKKKIDTLLIDLDGTLVDMRGVLVTYDFMRFCLTFLKAELGLRRAFKVLIRVHREMTRKQTPLAVAELTNDQKAIRAIARGTRISEAEAQALLTKLLAEVFPKLEPHFKPVAGAQDFILWAKKHFKLILATNPVWPVDVIVQRVRWAGLDPQNFSFISSATQMHHLKPDRRYYEEILNLNKLTADQCLHVGNEMEMDFPATEAGIPVFILSSRPKLRQLLRKKQKSPGFKGGFISLRKLLESHL